MADREWALWGAAGVAAGAAGFGVWWVSTRAERVGAAQLPGSQTATVGGVAYNPCDPMTLFCLLHHPVGGLPVPDALAWIPAQRAADLVWQSGISLFDLTHHPVGYYGPALIQTQYAADYLLRLGIDPCPPSIYAALASASSATGVPLPLLLAVAYTETRFLQYGQVPNSGCVPGICLPGQTGQAVGQPVGLMQVSGVACQQIGVPYADAVASVDANALAGAKYLAYLAGQYGFPPSSTDYSAWAPVLANAYGEGAAAAATIDQVQSASWLASQTPATATTTQAQRFTAAPTPPQTLVSSTVTCRTVTLLVNGVYQKVTTCDNGTWTLAS